MSASPPRGFAGQPEQGSPHVFECLMVVKAGLAGLDRVAGDHPPDLGHLRCPVGSGLVQVVQHERGFGESAGLRHHRDELDAGDADCLHVAGAEKLIDVGGQDPERPGLVAAAEYGTRLDGLARGLSTRGNLDVDGLVGQPIGAFGFASHRARVAERHQRQVQRLRVLPPRQDRAELAAVTALAAEGKLRPVIDRAYPLADVAAGLRQVEGGHVRGKIVITTT